jgi:hypothetical protein
LAGGAPSERGVRPVDGEFLCHRQLDARRAGASPN